MHSITGDVTEINMAEMQTDESEAGEDEYPKINCFSKGLHH